MTRPPFLQRKFIVHPRFQLLLAAKAVVFLFVYGSTIVYSSLQFMAETVYILPLSCLTPEVKAKLWGFPAEALLLSLLVGLVIVLQVILLSHRVAGPEFRLKRIIREMVDGQYPERVRLRKNDYLKGLAESLTFLAHALRERRQAQTDQLAQLLGKVQECTNHARTGVNPEVLMAHLEGVAGQICRLKQDLVGENGPGAANQAFPDPATPPVDSGSLPVPCGPA